MARLTILQCIKMGLGKLRRLYLHTLHREYIRRNLARRRGECRRCGACCRLMFDCPYLDQSSELTSCTRHHMRWWNCKIFPVDERDLSWATSWAQTFEKTEGRWKRSRAS